MLGPTTSMQIDLPCIQIQALKFKILNLSFLAVYIYISNIYLHIFINQCNNIYLSVYISLSAYLYHKNLFKWYLDMPIYALSTNCDVRYEPRPLPLPNIFLSIYPSMYYLSIFSLLPSIYLPENYLSIYFTFLSKYIYYITISICIYK